MNKRLANLIDRRCFLASALSGAAAACVEPRPSVSVPAALSPFPHEFMWGVATAAYQIEGAAAEDGKGPSVWDTFVKKPNVIFEGHTGDVACDHYHRWKEDLALLSDLGVGAYRFSVSWPRVIPAGTGAVNTKGLDFYDRVVDELLRRRITPFCTLFHWDLPQALEDRGGFRAREIADWFAEYTTVVARRLGDRVRWWVTQNEAAAFIGHALLDGAFAPGSKLPYREYLNAAHNSLRAHGKQVDALRAAAPGSKVGYVLATQGARPVSDTPADIEAARAATFTVEERHPWNNAWWIDPIMAGAYPSSGLSLFGADVPTFPASDFAEIKRPLDFLGLNIYTAFNYRRGPDGRPQRVPWPPGYPRSAVDWQPIVPDALYWAPRFFWERFKLPLFITENGLPTRDQIYLDGAVHDPQRIDYMHRVLLDLARASKEGVDVRGYFAWSLLDNFEWAEGYKERFGLVYVDYATQARIPKDSFRWYRDLIAGAGRVLESGAVRGVTP